MIKDLLRPQYLPEVLQFRTYKPEKGCKIEIPHLDEFLQNQFFISLDSGVIVPLNDRNKEKLRIDDALIASMPKEVIEFNPSHDSTRNFLHDLNESQLYGREENLFHWLEQRFGYSLKVQSNKTKDLDVFFNIENKKRKLWIKMSSQAQPYFPEVLLQSRTLEKFMDCSKGYLGYCRRVYEEWEKNSFMRFSVNY